MSTENLIFFDLEGPLSPQDNAYELMKLIPNGASIFEVISRYDDILALERRPGYEPGDTLALIVPFLLHHRIAEKTIADFAEKAGLVAGARELISKLKDRGWEIYCISTSYQQYAIRIAQRVGMVAENVACTRFPLDEYHIRLRQSDFGELKSVEEDLLTMRPVDDDPRIKKRLDRFYWADLPQVELGAVVAEVKPMGGQRKVDALMRFAGGRPLSRAIAVGDSITDWKMLEAVRKAGGLAVAFNANEYALPYVTMGLASTSLGDLFEVAEAWRLGHRETAEALVRSKEREGGHGDRGYFHWLEGRASLEEPLQIHKRIRRLVREEASKLG